MNTKGSILVNTILFTENTKENIEKAAEIIRRGGLLGIPTETVYGLGANALNADACRRIYEAKGRPQDNPLIIHVPDASCRNHSEGISRRHERRSSSKTRRIAVLKSCP